jgi:hypothetical protein
MNVALCIALVLCVLVVIASARVESASKHAYADSLSGLYLAGVGIRKKGPVKVYSVGLYVDKKECVKNCGDPFNKNFGSKLADSSYAKELILKMARDVTADKMANAIAEVVGGRMGGKDSKQLEDLRSAMENGFAKSGGAKTGCCLSFKSLRSKLIFSINGKKQVEVGSAVLVRAFLNTYVDQNCVSPGLKSDICETVKGWLE